MRTQRVAAMLLLALALLAGCGAATPRAAGPGDGGAPSATLPALRTKIAAIAGDECATQPAEQAYVRCARFVREVQNVVPAARAESGAVPSAEVLTRAADDVDGAVNRLTQDGCVATGGAPVGAPAVCGPDLAMLQEGFRALVAAVGP